MAAWIIRTFQQDPSPDCGNDLSGPNLGSGSGGRGFRRHEPLRVTLTPYSCETGRIGTDIEVGAVTAQETLSRAQ